jgi:hypothetical protein
LLYQFAIFVLFTVRAEMNTTSHPSIQAAERPISPALGECIYETLRPAPRLLLGRRERLLAYLDSQRQIRISDSTYKARIERWLAASRFVALPEPSPFPVEGPFPPAVTLFNGLLEGVCVKGDGGFAVSTNIFP